MSKHGARTRVRILVTGSLGVVGAGLTAQLRDRGHTVIGCDLSHQADEIGYSVRTDAPTATYSRCDVGDYRQLERVFTHLGPFDVVYHTAAEFGRWNGEDYTEQLWRTNAVGTKNVLRLQERYGFRLVHFSSSEVYGDTAGVMTEDRPSSQMLNDYALSKWVNEQQIANSTGQTVTVRLFNTYGPGEHPSPYRSVNVRLLHCALNNLPYTVHRGHTRTSTYLADTVRTLCNITDNFKPGAVYNIGGDTPHSIEELSDLILEVAGADPSLVTYAEPEPMTTLSKLVDTSRSVEDLDHQNTVSLEDGLRLTAEWITRVQLGVSKSPVP